MRNLSKKRLLLPILFLLIFSAAAHSQDPAVDDETINVDTLLLNVPVIVGNRDGSYIGGLKKENFYIVENGVKRPVDFFADDSAPLNVAIMIDTSGSTTFVMDEIKEAANDFIKVLRPEDKALIASFDTRTTIWSDFTSDQKQLNKAISKINSMGDSILYDGMYLIMKKYFAPLKGRKAIIVLTDGMVGGRGVSEPILLQALSESDIIVYPLMFVPEFSGGARSILPEKAKQFQELTKKQGAGRMNQLSLISGGKTVDSAETNLKVAFQQIADELKKQYVIGFYPTNEKGEKTFKVGLQLDPKVYNLQNTVLRTKKTIRFKSPPKKKSPEANSGIQNN
jgi:VWFA-related protein